MRLTDGWSAARVIEIDVASGTLGNHLVESGCQRYLGVVRDCKHRDAVVERFPALSGHLAVSGSKRIVRQNNADVLILNGLAALALLRFRNVRHARQVLFEIRLSPVCAIALLAGMFQWLLRRATRPRIINACGGMERLVVFHVRRPRPHSGARRYVPHTLGVEGFLMQLKRAGVRHTVLRWFESLPYVPPGEDLDLLIEDAGLEVVQKTLDEGPGVQPIDLYTVTGLPGSDFRGLPYYPPYLAEQLLERAIDHRGLCSVPAPREHFLSLAYHALYHKGAQSGLPSQNGVQRIDAGGDHDYVGILDRLASQLEIAVAIDLDSLDKYLNAEGWRPPHDMLIRLAKQNHWIRSRLEQPHNEQRDDRLAVFLLRSVGMERGGIARASELLIEHGFRVLGARAFGPNTVVAISRTIRGGNWGRGPWPVSGGPPVAAIVAYDPAPVTPTGRQKRRFPFLANARLLAKEQIRDAFNEGYPREQHCNVIHSSDNGREALDYLRITGTDFAAEVLGKVQSLQQGSTSLNLVDSSGGENLFMRPAA